MNFYQHIPAGDIARHIDVMMHYTDFMPDHSIERVVPTGNVFIIFELDGFTRHTYDNISLEPNGTFTKVWISGLHKNYISISAHEHSSMFVIQFNTTGAYPFLYQPMTEIAEKVLPAEDVLGNSIIALREDLVNAATPDEKFALAEQWLNLQYKNELTAPGELQSAIQQLKLEPVAHFNKVLDNYPKTQKHLIDLFKKHVGTTPKYYQRILRFNDILQRIQHKQKVSWTDIAYNCGYSDQSHFIKEFKHFSGFNPQEFIEQEHNKQPNFFPLDKS